MYKKSKENYLKCQRWRLGLYTLYNFQQFFILQSGSGKQTLLYKKIVISYLKKVCSVIILSLDDKCSCKITSLLVPNEFWNMTSFFSHRSSRRSRSRSQSRDVDKKPAKIEQSPEAAAKAENNSSPVQPAAPKEEPQFEWKSVSRLLETSWTQSMAFLKRICPLARLHNIGIFWRQFHCLNICFIPWSSYLLLLTALTCRCVSLLLNYRFVLSET